MEKIKKISCVSLIHLKHYFRRYIFLDEINLLPTNLIELLRNTLNDRIQKVQRIHGTLEYPCNFIMVSAMNPCKCGWYGHYVCPECNQIYFTSEKN